MNKIFIPEEIKNILNILNKNGYEAYVVGGCVRDAILNKFPKDYDICTSALPEIVEEIFKDYEIIETGLKHGTITLLGEDDSYEITTFRIDGEYSDGRHPDKIEFTSNLKEDLSRRDLTINSLAADKDGNIIDYFNGINDINNKIIRCVGDPYKRYNEDALRILRTLRFSSVLCFEIEENTKKAIFDLYKNLDFISQERISSELVKLLNGDNSIKILKEYFEILFHIIPELKPLYKFNQNNPHHDLDAFEHTLKVVENVKHKNDLVLIFAALFHDIGKPDCYSEDEKGIGHFYNHHKLSEKMTIDILTRMRYPNDFIKNVSELVLFHDRQIAVSKKSILKLLNQISKKNFERLLVLKKADRLGKENIIQHSEIKEIEEIENLLNSLVLNKECFSLKSLKINGKDLIELGLIPGQQFKIILEELLDLVIEEKLENNKEKLINFVKNVYL